MWFFNFFKKNNFKQKVKLGLALGGGGARGLGHIGVIRALEELGVKVSYVSGTSAGSIIASMFCYGLSSNQMEEFALSIKPSDIKKKNFFAVSSSTEALEETMLKIFGKDIVFSELKTPLCAVAVNLKDGSEVRIDSGSVIKAICASSAVPGVFKPVVYRGMHLVDGGLANNVPADVVRDMGADFVIAVDVNPVRGKGTESLKLTQILSSTLGVIMQKNVDAKLKFADVAILPDLGEFSSSKMGNVKLMIQRGYDAVMAHKNEILRLISQKPKQKRNVIWRIEKQKETTNQE